MEKRVWIRRLFIYAGIGIVYYAMTLPYVTFKFPDGYSELRFTGLITGAVGLLYGFPGALACAIGNLVGDLQNGMDIYCLFGFLGNFCMAWLPYKLWHTLFLGGRKDPVYLESPGTVLKFVGIAFISGNIAVGMIAASGHLLGGYVYGNFFAPVSLQYYDLSVLGGMLIFHICTTRFHITPYIPEGVYKQKYKKGRYVPDLVLANAAVFLSLFLAVCTLHPKLKDRGFVTGVCILFLVITAVLALLPMKRSPAIEDVVVEYHPAKGLTAHFILLFLTILCVTTVFFTTSSFRMLYRDYIYAAQESQDMSMLWIRVFKNVALEGTLLIGILSVVLYKIQKKVIQPAGLVAEYAVRFVEGQTLSEERLMLPKTDTELDDLSQSVDCMAENIRSFVEDIRLRTMKEEKLAAELSVARNIQQGMLPEPWAGTGFDLVPYIKPAKEVGGDFYHFVQLDENRVFICIADVSGKDISAAMFMVQAKTLIDANCELPPNEMFGKVNEILSQKNPAMMFVTAFAAIVDRKEKTMLYANAGHNAPICCCDKEVRWLLDEADFVLGPMSNMKYSLRKVTYKTEFQLFIYTDGVNEAESTEKGFFGEERLLSCVEEAFQAGSNCAETIERIEDVLDRFTEGAQQSDDITMLVLAVKEERRTNG